MTQEQIIEALEREHGLGMAGLSDRPHVALSGRDRSGFIDALRSGLRDQPPHRLGPADLLDRGDLVDLGEQVGLKSNAD